MVAFSKEFSLVQSPAKYRICVERTYGHLSDLTEFCGQESRMVTGKNGRCRYDVCLSPSLAQSEQRRQETKEETLFFTTDEYYPVNDRVLARFGGAAKLLEKFGSFLSDLDYIDSRTGNQIKQFLGIDDTITPVLRYGRETFFVNSDYVFGGTEYLGSSAMTIYGPQDIANSPTLQRFMEIMGTSDPLQYNRIVKVRHYTEAIWRKPGE